MSGWNNINVEDHPRHPLRPKILQVMKSVYKHLDPSNMPFGIDHWWHSPSLSYQVEQSNPLEPSIVILNLREGLSDHPSMNTHFMINLNTYRIHDKFKNEPFPAPPETLEILGEIKQFVRDSLIAGRKRRDENLRLQREIEQMKMAERKAREKAYRDRLLENQCIEWDANPTPAGSCPACFSTAGDKTSANSLLVQCITCRKVGCSKDGCEGHVIDGIERCRDHSDQAQCKACRTGETKTKLITCPGCKQWYCFHDLSRCFGRPLPIAPLPVKTEGGSDELAMPTKTPERKKQTRPQHALKTAPCRRCTTGTNSWHRCDMPSCWSGGEMVCNDCSPEGGLKCSQGHTWICDACSHGQPFKVWACPGCFKLFCQSCSAPDRCFACGKSCLCMNCVKLGSDPDSDSKDNQLSTDGPDDKADLETTIAPLKSLSWECESCGGKLCYGCTTNGGVISCDNCSNETCKECARTDQCVECGVMMCQRCDDEHCNHCNGLGKYKLENLAYEMYDGYDLY